MYPNIACQKSTDELLWGSKWHSDQHKKQQQKRKLLILLYMYQILFYAVLLLLICRLWS